MVSLLCRNTSIQEVLKCVLKASPHTHLCKEQSLDSSQAAADAVSMPGKLAQGILSALGDFTILNGFSKDSIISWAFRCAVVKAFLFPSFSSHSLKERKRKGRNINTNLLLVWLLPFHAVLLLTLTSHWQKWPSRDRELTLQAPPIPAVLVRPHACQSQYHCHTFPPYFFQHFHTVLSDY